MAGLSQEQFTQLQALESDVLKIKYLDTVQEKEKTRQRELELFGIYLA